MKKYATLLIKNIDKIYTMRKKQGEWEILNHAFIAIHHDHIIAISTKNYQKYVESDTRIIDGCGHVCVPAFIELDLKLPSSCSRDAFRLHLEACIKQMKHGSLTLQSADFSEVLKEYVQFELIKRNEDLYNLVYPFIENKEIKTPFCISGASVYGMQTQLMAAQLLYLQQNYDANTLLQALTIWPAKQMKRKDIGCLRVHGQADLILFACKNLDDIFSILGNEYVSQVVKKGIRVFPNILIS